MKLRSTIRRFRRLIPEPPAEVTLRWIGPDGKPSYTLYPDGTEIWHDDDDVPQRALSVPCRIAADRKESDMTTTQTPRQMRSRPGTSHPGQPSPTGRRDAAVPGWARSGCWR